jgi:hypothetical protein
MLNTVDWLISDQKRGGRAIWPLPIDYGLDEFPLELYPP